jgi:tagatose-6-phosphate ketose/aldose isomerase
MRSILPENVKEDPLQNSLQALLDLPGEEKDERGLRHTPKEISQQPDTWESTFQECDRQRVELRSFLNRAGVGSQSPAAPSIYLVGAGTSDYVGRALADLLRQCWSSPVWAVPSTDLLINLDSLILRGRDYLWISFSRSGDSSEGVAVLEKVLKAYPHVHHLVVTCNKSGRMAELCSRNPDKMLALILNEAVNDRGLAMTSSFTNMVVAGQCLAHIDQLELYGKILESVREIGSKFLHQAAASANRVAAMNFSKACFLGSGPLAAVANESALKLLELTAGKTPTISESVLGFRHGPMSSLDKSTLFTQFISNDPRRQKYEIDLLTEIRDKDLAGITVAVAPQHLSGLESIADHVLSLGVPKALKDEYRPQVDVMFAQLLGLFSSLNAGLQPDHPSPNGAINRVVAHLQIYS